MKVLRLPTRVSTVAYWFASAAHAIPPLVRVSPWRSWKLGDSLPGPGLLLLPAALLRLLSREREWDLSGLQTFHPVPLLCSRTPVESTCPRHWRPRRCCPRSLDNEGFGDDCISGLTRSFGTCCHTLHAWRCRTRARLASGWRAAPLPGGSRTLWTATKGFSSFSRPSSFPVSP